MHLIVLTAKTMLRRAADNRGTLWICGLTTFSLLLLAPSETMPIKLISLPVLLPAVFLLTGWSDSKSRIGLSSLVFRTGGERSIRLTEVVLPASSGIALGGLCSLLLSSSIPWQFWPVLTLCSLGFSLSIIAVESYFKYPGRALFTALWIISLNRMSPGTSAAQLASVIDYPYAVLTADSATEGFHPDTYLVASLLLLILSLAVYTLPGRLKR